MFKTKIKIVVVGNCQARPIAQALLALNSNIEIISVVIVHLLQEKNEKEYFSYFSEADIILTQLIADTYPCWFVRTGVLKSKYPKKVIAIINLYYSGYNPDLKYLRDTPQGTLKSPLQEYHNQTFLESWRKGHSVSQTLDLYYDFDYNKKMYHSVSLRSLKELDEREKQSDISIVSYIKNNLKSERLFFTFNHPRMSLIVEMVKQVLYIANIPVCSESTIYFKAEPLDKIIAPINIFSRKELAIEFSDTKAFKGIEFYIDQDNLIQTTNKTKHYTVEKIIEDYFSIYDAVLEPVRECENNCVNPNN